jgi:hypothetical protein
MGFWIRTSNFMFFVVNWLVKGEIEKPSGQYLHLISDELLTCRGLNSNSGHFGCFTFIFVSFGESCLLVSWCAGGRCGMTSSNKNHGWSRRPSAEEMRSTSFLVEPQNQGWWFVSCLVSKQVGRFLPVWPQNRWCQYLLVWPQNRWLRGFRFVLRNRQLRFGDLGLKITVTVSWFEPQNQASYDLSVTPQNRWEDDVTPGF